MSAPACRIVDVTEPLAPSALGTFFCGWAVPFDQRFVVNLWSPGFGIWDLADPLDPVQIAGESGLALRSGAVADQLLVVAEGDSARIWDLIDPSNPVERGSIPAPLADTRLALTTPDLDRAEFLTDRAEMVTVDISDPDGGVDRVDVGDPSQPQLIQRFAVGGTVSRLLAAPGGGVLAVAGDGGIARIQESGVVLAPQSLDKPSALRRRVD